MRGEMLGGLKPLRTFRTASLAVSGSALLSSCSPLDRLWQCPEGDQIRASELIDIEVGRLVRASQARFDKFRPYSSVAEFYDVNPACCFLSRSSSYDGRVIELPLYSPVEMSIRYRRLREGREPFALRTSQTNPCPSDFEYSERSLDERSYKASLRWKLGWRVR